MTGRDANRLPVVSIDGIEIHAVPFERAVALITAWATDGSGGYVCTPNVDYVVKARRDRRFRAAVMGARLRLSDGMGIVYGARIAGTPLPETVTGRLLPAAVGARLAQAGASIALYGGHPGVAGRAAHNLRSRGIRAAAVEPPMALEIGSDADAEAVAKLRATGAKIAFVGLGAPRQELWMAAHADDLPGVVLVGVGAALDVLAGRFRAAPRWMTRVGLEWLFRLAQEPRRLARRYLWDDPRFFLWMLEARVRRAITGD
jgi:N-acetylglucosaminyldiphosphoundecaprenol N-acetyl-beta-D-mannosaminyltransferase